MEIDYSIVEGAEQEVNARIDDIRACLPPHEFKTHCFNLSNREKGKQNRPAVMKALLSYPKAFLIIRSGGLGDVLMCSRIPELIKAKYGAGTVVWFATTVTHAGLFRSIADTRVVYRGDSPSLDMPTLGIGRIYKDKPTTRLNLNLFKQLIKRRDFEPVSAANKFEEEITHNYIDGVIDINNLGKPVKWPWGIVYPGIEEVFDAVYELNSVPERSGERFDKNRQDILSEACGVVIPEGTEDFAPDMPLADDEIQWAKQYLAACPAKKGYIGVVLSAVSDTRCWPEVHYEALVYDLTVRGYVPVLFDATRRDWEALGGRVINTTGTLTIREAATLIRECAVVVTPDTGLLHIAASQYVPTVAIFGNMPPEYRIAYYPTVDAMVPPVGTCLKYPCFDWERGNCIDVIGPKHLPAPCMASITAEMVAEKVVEMRGGKRKIKFVPTTVKSIVEIKKSEPIIRTYAPDALNIEYIGPILDPSGYASATRKNIIALDLVGHNVSCKHHNFDGQQRPDLGKEEEIIYRCLDKKIKPDVRIFQMIPSVVGEIYKKELSESIPNLLYFAWETTMIPNDWVDALTSVDILLVPSNFQKKIIKEAGIKTPVVVIGHAIDTDYFKATQQKDTSGKFVFYSIFQWLERKNPQGLLRAYWSEFKNNNDVKLVIKTYRGNTSEAETKKLMDEFYKLRLAFPLSAKSSPHEYPEVELVTTLLDGSEMLDLHNSGDCFVLLHRGEGFGLPIAEAMACEKPVIATNFYACEDYLTEKNSYPIGYILEPVHSMMWSCYDGEQCWAVPDIMQAKKSMRHAYENRKALHKMGKEARKTIQAQYSIGAVGKLFDAVLRDAVMKNYRLEMAI